MSDFAAFGLPEPIANALAQLNFNTPTPIQANVIPLALQGKDILGSAETGTGKTGAFGIPLAAMLEACERQTAIVLAPTRELAVQIHDALRGFLGRNSRHRSALLIGGEAYFKQFQQLKTRPRLIVGTPGRVIDHLQRGSLNLATTRMLVLDEMDRMLDMGFGEQIDAIVEAIPAARQTLMFTATMPREIEERAARYLREPERIAVAAANKAADTVTQRMVQTRADEKYDTLMGELVTATSTVIVFVKTKMGADELSDALNEEGVSATALHGDLKQRQRDAVIKKVKAGRVRVLVATDVAARGLDIRDVAKVINYDLPMNPEDYIHRIGRTGRNGAEGEAVSFVSPAEKGKWFAIQRLLNPEQFANSRRPRTGNYGPRKDREGYGHRREETPWFKKKDGNFGERRDGFKPRFGDNDRGERREFRGDRDFHGKREGFVDYNDAPRDRGHDDRRDFRGNRDGFQDRRPSFRRDYDDFRPQGQEGERREFRGDRPNQGEGRDGFKPRKFGPRPEGERKEFHGERKEFHGDREGFKPRREFQGDREGFKPRREDGERKPFQGDREGFKSRTHENRDDRRDGGFGPKKFGPKKFDGERKFGAKPGAKKPYGDKPAGTRDGGFTGPRRKRDAA